MYLLCVNLYLAYVCVLVVCAHRFCKYMCFVCVVFISFYACMFYMHHKFHSYICMLNEHVSMCVLYVLHVYICAYVLYGCSVCVFLEGNECSASLKKI